METSPRWSGWLPSDALERAQLAQRVIRAIWSTDKPVVAAVEGAAFGAGPRWPPPATAWSRRGTRRFATTFTKVGLAGDMGAFVSLPARVGVARARQMLMLPEHDHRAGGSRHRPRRRPRRAGSALGQALERCARLAAGPAEALAVIKSLLAAAPVCRRSTCSTAKPPDQAALFDSDDFVEGIAAFREKRPAVFGATEGARA